MRLSAFMLPPLNFYFAILPVLLVAGALLIAVEVLWSASRGARIYSREQLISDLSCAAVRLAAELCVNGGFILLYRCIQVHYALPVLDAGSLCTWVISVVAFEWVFYWTHRWSHSIPVLWAVHAVHHESNNFNLGAGMRLGALAPLLNYPFFLSLTLVGVPVEGFMLALYVSGCWQFMLHANLPTVGIRLGWLLNLPHHHRVHHGTGKDTSTRNFAGVLVCLDRIFGTYQEASDGSEACLPRFIVPCGPIKANLDPWRRLTPLLRSHWQVARLFLPARRLRSPEQGIGTAEEKIGTRLRM